VRVAVTDHGQHGRPEESFSDGIDAKSHQRHGESLHVRGHREADEGDHRTGEEQTDGGEFQFCLKPMGAEAQAEHDGGCPEEEVFTLL